MTTWRDIDRQAADDRRWPAARLDPLARLRVLAAGLPGVVLEERRLAVPFDQAWGFIGDLERSVPTFDSSVARVRIVEQQGTRLRIATRGTWRTGFAPLGFDVDLEPGWCWMVSRPRAYVVGMAAVPDGDGTRYGHLEGAASTVRLLQPALAALRGKHRRHVHSDLAGIEAALGGR